MALSFQKEEYKVIRVIKQCAGGYCQGMLLHQTIVSINRQTTMVLQ